MKAVKYILAMEIAGELTIVIFPAIIEQLFGKGRGTEGLENLQRSFAEYWKYFKEYCGILNEQLFGGFFWIILVLIIMGLLYGLIKKDIDVSDRVWDVCIGRSTGAESYYQYDRYGNVISEEMYEDGAELYTRNTYTTEERVRETVQ